MYKSRCGRPSPWLPVPNLNFTNSPYGLCGPKATLNLNFTNTQLSRCIKVDVVVPVLDSLSQIVLMVRVGLKQH